MKAWGAIVVILLIGMSCFAQADSLSKTFTVVEQMPQFRGGSEALKNFIGQNIVYPEYEKNKNIQGRVVVKFVVDTDGTITDATVIKHISPGLDSEAIRVVKLLPRFTPGYQQGKTARVYFTLPVSFKLTEPVAQDSVVTRKDSDTSKVYTFVDNNPQFRGGDGALMEFLHKNTRYPKSAKEKGLAGQVLIRLVVDTDGSVTNVQVVRSVDTDLDAEAVRVVKLLPKFLPGKQNGKPVKVYFNLPVIFRL